MKQQQTIESQSSSTVCAYNYYFCIQTYWLTLVDTQMKDDLQIIEHNPLSTLCQRFVNALPFISGTPGMSTCKRVRPPSGLDI